MKKIKAVKTIAVVLSTIGLAACSTVPKDGGIGRVEERINQDTDFAITLPTLGEALPISYAEVDQALENPITLEEAERLSVGANPALKSKLAQVGIAEADYAQAARMENPGVTYERFSGADNSASILFDIGGLLLMPLKRQMESRRLEAARYGAAVDVLTHVGETRRAWITAVAEQQQSELMRRALKSLRTSNRLTRQMAAIGHSGVIEAAQSELVMGQMQASLSRQLLAEGAAREALIRQLGLWGEQARNLKLPDQLPVLPSEPTDIPAVEREAIERRLDVQMAKFNLEGMAKNLKLTRLNPFFSSIEYGPVREESDGEVERGYELEFRLPIFDIGDVQTRKAKIIYEQAQAQAQVTAVAAASSARQALASYQSAWEIADHMENTLVPLRRRISDEQLLQYNGMLISVFDLLRDVVAATTIESDYLNALRDFWIADANLQLALTGAGGMEMNFAGSSMMPGGAGAGADH